MKRLSSKQIILLLITCNSTMSFAESGSCWLSTHGRQYAMHTNPDKYWEKTRCCKIKQCKKGEEFVICDTENPNTTKCIACKRGYYQSRPTMSNGSDVQCKEHRQCNAARGLVVLEPGSAIKNTVCGCNAEKGYYSKDAKESQICEFCRLGTQWNQTQGACVQCPPKFFRSNIKEQHCKPMTPCSGGIVEVEGTAERDRKCGPAKPVFGIKIVPSPYFRENKTSVSDPVRRVPSMMNPDSSPWLRLLPVISSIFMLLLLVLVAVVLLKRRTRCKNSRKNGWAICPKCKTVFQEEKSVLLEIREDRSAEQNKGAAPPPVAPQVPDADQGYVSCENLCETCRRRSGGLTGSGNGHSDATRIEDARSGVDKIASENADDSGTDEDLKISLRTCGSSIVCRGQALSVGVTEDNSELTNLKEFYRNDLEQDGTNDDDETHMDKDESVTVAVEEDDSQTCSGPPSNVSYVVNVSGKSAHIYVGENGKMCCPPVEHTLDVY